MTRKHTHTSRIREQRTSTPHTPTKQLRGRRGASLVVVVGLVDLLVEHLLAAALGRGGRRGGVVRHGLAHGAVDGLGVVGLGLGLGLDCEMVQAID